MASKKTKKILIWLGVIAAVVGFAGRPLATSIRLAGTWNSIPWAKIQTDYPGLSIGLFSNVVTVSSRPDLKGTLSGNVITWNNGSTWTKS